MAIAFDPAYLTATEAEKALAAGFRSRGDRVRTQGQSDVVAYRRCLAHPEYVYRRDLALEAFRSNLDLETLVCLREAAIRDPRYAFLYQRLRQYEMRRGLVGDQRDEFEKLHEYLMGGNGHADQPGQEQAWERDVGGPGGAVADGLGAPGGALALWDPGEGESEDAGDDGR